MTILTYLIPVALFLGGASLVAFIWALKRSPYFRDAKRNMIQWEDRFEANYHAWEAAAR